MAATALECAGFDECVLYLAKDRQIAATLMWGKLHQIAREYKLPWSFNETTLRIDHPNGGFLLVRGAEGANPKEERDKLRGLKCKRVLIDEPATYAEILDELLSEVIEPALRIPRGDCVIAGTPGFICAGSWYEISTGKSGKKDRSKWKRFRWPGDRNPYGEPGYLEKVKQENGFTDDDPLFRIEYHGEWTVSDALQVFRYVESRNCVDVVPGYDRRTWVHSLAVDFGIKDACAWTVVASHPHSRDTYVLESFKETGKRPDEAADITRALVEKYEPSVLVGDAGNLGGNLYVEAINERLGPRASANMIAAQKSEKRAHIDLLNNDFRAPRLFLLRETTKPLQKELLELPWANAQQREAHKAYDDHACDSLLYAFRHHSAYMHEAPSPSTWRTPVRGEADYEQHLIDMEVEQSKALHERPWWSR